MNSIIVAQHHVNEPTKAAEQIQYVDYFIAGDTLVIASASTVGRLYVVTASECSCEAGRQELPCWHAAARLHLFFPRGSIHTVTSTLED
ncbi:MAG: hypothetical protein M3R24_27635 [Chloroflexota bacterium]|nr:hypothetical protein [Chloroflexota bacterium]